MGGRSGDDPGNGAVVALAGGSWQCSGIAGFPKVVESISGAGGEREGGPAISPAAWGRRGV